ncbi:MAG: hypothetical protein EKK33_05120 [Bradyrhizobiaceae bacterium]|nr:MAG: hypothetical protein EKK33_05120 [Bradyrhizobiaceae bacterium]
MNIAAGLDPDVVVALAQLVLLEEALEVRLRPRAQVKRRLEQRLSIAIDRIPATYVFERVPDHDVGRLEFEFDRDLDRVLDRLGKVVEKTAKPVPSVNAILKHY